MTSLYTCDRWCMHVYTHTHIYGAQLCLTLCDPMNYSPPGSSVRGILLARILEWATISPPRESSRLTDQSVICYVSCIGRWILYHYHHLGSPYVCVCVCIYSCTCIYTHIYYLVFFFHFTVYQECFPSVPFFLGTAQRSLVFTSVSINTHPLLTSIGLLLTLNNYHLSYLLVIVPQQHSYPYKQGFAVASPICASWLWFAVTGGIP